MDLPEQLKPLRPYLQHAKQIGNFEPLVAYYCRYHAVQLGMEILSQTNNPEVKSSLLALLEKLESEKKGLLDRLKQPENQAPYVINFANKIFDKANKEDREGNTTKATALSFYACSIFYEVLKQFGDLDSEIEERLKYAKWKASDISTAFKEGRKPISGSAHRPQEIPPPDESSFPTIPEGTSTNDPPEPLDDKVLEKKEEPSEKQTEAEKEDSEEDLVPLTYTMDPYDTMGASAEAIDDAHKYARYAVSALQFEDRENAILNLTTALNCLGVQLPSQ